MRKNCDAPQRRVAAVIHSLPRRQERMEQRDEKREEKRKTSNEACGSRRTPKGKRHRGRAHCPESKRETVITNRPREKGNRENVLRASSFNRKILSFAAASRETGQKDPKRPRDDGTGRAGRKHNGRKPATKTIAAN